MTGAAPGVALSAGSIVFNAGVAGATGSAGPQGTNFGAGGAGGGSGIYYSGTSITISNGATISGGGGGAGSDNLNAGTGNGGGGGGGGSGLTATLGAVQIENWGSLIGGAGGTGGSSGFGGGGGGGGDGLLSLGSSAMITNVGSITGGDGGAGGAGFFAGGASGAGGAGVNLVGGFNVLTNAGTITGGGSNGGAAGVGIITRGRDLIVNAGTISGGLAGGTRAAAIEFGGTGNRLDLLTGSTIIGSIAIDAGASATIAGQNAGLTLGNAISLADSASALTLETSTTSLVASGAISGAGAVTFIGNHTLTLSGVNTYTGATTISSGTLALSGNGSIAASAGLVDNGVFDISGTSAGASIRALTGSGVVALGSRTLTLSNAIGSFGGVIGGAGGVMIAGGTQTLTGVNTYSGATIVGNGATLALGAGGSIAASSGVTTNGTLDISATASGASVASLAGSGTVALGAGTLTLTNAAGTFSGTVAGSGGLTLNGGTERLTGTSTYTGATTINAGTLALAGMGGLSSATRLALAGSGATFDLSAAGAQSIADLSGVAGSHIVLGANALTVTMGGNGSFDGTLIGSGSFTKQGTGTLVLNGVSSGFAGTTTVADGTLKVGDASTPSAALGGTVIVGALGTLGGSGTVGNTLINGGTLSPGNSIGLLTVAGNLTFTSASTYSVEVSPANADRVNVTGTATLGGATVAASYAPGSYVARRYTILNAAGGVNGTFSGAVNTNLPASFFGSLSYDTNNAYLNLTLNFANLNFGSGLNSNQQQVASTLTDYFNTTSGIPLTFGALTPAGLSVASGELGTGVIQSSLKADDLFLNLLLDQTTAGRAGGFAPEEAPFATGEAALSYAGRPAGRSADQTYAMVAKAPQYASHAFNPWSSWAAGYGGAQTIAGNAVVGSQDTRAQVWGVAAGADYRLSPDTVVGFALGGGGTTYAVANGFGSGSADLFQAGAYGRHQYGSAYVSAAFAYGWHDVTTTRSVALAGIDRLEGRFRADSFSGRFEGGYRFTTPFAGLTPYAAVQAINFDLPAYAEQSLVGGGLFALNYGAQTTTDTRTEFGFRSDKSFAIRDSVLTLRGRLAWAHDYNPDRAVRAAFQSLPGTSFVVNGARPDPDSALVSASAETTWLNGVSLGATFEGEFSGNLTSYAGKGVLKYSW
ncbi:autotransporter [Bradyrhizobium guangdongense]|uniref:Autotransporter n=1 Tax=Bradyrhizobium guangdongense TaxID=1325090 RepID=A0AA87W258_9BRAD|nr:autotransporter [Bradyrhizobium guangdongense]